MEVGRVADAAAAAVEEVGIDQRRPNFAVARQFLHRPDVIAVFDQVRGDGRIAGRTGLRRCGRRARAWACRGTG